jgi:hypothetical protein
MGHLKKYFFCSLLLVCFASFVQVNVSDIESTLNSYSATDQNHDYDNNGTADAEAESETDHHPSLSSSGSIIFVKQAFVLTPPRPIVPSHSFAHLRMMPLSDFVLFIFRPPSQV